MFNKHCLIKKCARASQPRPKDAHLFINLGVLCVLGLPFEMARHASLMFVLRVFHVAAIEGSIESF